MTETAPDIRIFISYRRDDAGVFSGSIYRSLKAYFGEGRVFRDVDSIEPGMPWDAAIDDAVGSCDACLVLIGPRWATVTDEKGSRRLDDERDRHRREIEVALGRGIRVFPVLLEDTKMPPGEELPETIRALPGIHGRRIRDDETFDWSVGELIRSIEKAGDADRERAGTEAPVGPPGAVPGADGVAPTAHGEPDGSQDVALTPNGAAAVPPVHFELDPRFGMTVRAVMRWLSVRGRGLESTGQILACAASLTLIAGLFVGWIASRGLVPNDSVGGDLLFGAIRALPLAVVLVLSGRSRMRWTITMLLAVALGAGLNLAASQLPPDMRYWAVGNAGKASASLAASRSPRLVLSGALLGAVAASIWYQLSRDFSIDSEALRILVVYGLPGMVTGTAIAAAIALAPRVTTRV
jgi:TIR domain